MRRCQTIPTLALASALLAVSPALAAGNAPGETPAAPGADIDLLRAGSAAAYESGQCSVVLDALSQIESAGGAFDGVDLYRRGFCLARTRQPGAEEQYRLAAARLGESVKAAGAEVDTHFYRVNALLNLELPSEARAAAAYATKRFADGELVVTQESPDAWFRLGKLFRDAGDNEGALDPFRRALDAAEAGETPLRSAYLQRIARAAREAGKPELATRAAEMDAGANAPGPAARFAAARALVTKGALEEARDAFQGLRHQTSSELGIKARYAAGVIDRALEVKGWKRQPVAALPDGRSVASLELGELQAEIYAVAREAAKVIAEGEIVVKPRKKRKERMIYHAAKSEAVVLRDLQARLTGLLLESVQRDAPLREWAVSGGFAHMVHTPLPRLFQIEAEKRATSADGTSPAD